MLFNKMRNNRVTADVISRSAAISAREKGKRWEQAWMLLHKMRETSTIEFQGFGFDYLGL